MQDQYWADDGPEIDTRTPAEILEDEAVERAAMYGYRRAGDETWARARHDYLAGETAEAVCDRHGLKLGTLRHRAAHEGWRRQDQDDPEPADPALDLAADLEGAPPDPVEMTRHVLVRLNRAIAAGRAIEAGRWMRLYQSLVGLAALAPPTPPEPAPEPAPDPEERDLMDRVMDQVAEIEAIAREALALPEDDLAGRAALMARAEALEDFSQAALSDDSDDSDPVFSDAGSETQPP
ncbi:hypothetical protein [Brevundimonas sp.]|jgi:hypothetical protein|uniref:hypothetical protein n=1 Tax=Brevundimonas sp. TaxID=1871086 RepID=UPI0017F3FCDE|nr:hypothetical protein [Brevundimonas sp.]MBA4808754.1 hypothetical protein [Brevundimonas sp.]